MKQEITKKCFLCEEKNAIINKNNNKPIYEISCENCGKYKITDVLLKVITRKQKQAAIWFVKNNTDKLIDTENIKYIEQEYKIYMQSNHC